MPFSLYIAPVSKFGEFNNGGGDGDDEENRGRAAASSSIVEAEDSRFCCYEPHGGVIAGMGGGCDRHMQRQGGSSTLQHAVKVNQRR